MSSTRCSIKIIFESYDISSAPGTLSADLGALVALLTDDVFIAMPPMPFGYEGRDVVARFCASLFGAGRRFDLVPT